MENTRNNTVTPAVTMESLQETIKDITNLVQDLQEAMKICTKNQKFVFGEWLQLNGQNPGNHQNSHLLSNNVKDSSCGLHVIGNVDDLVINDSHCEVDLRKNECAHKMFDQMSRKGEGFKVSDAYVNESIEEENRLVEDVTVKTSKSVESEFLVMEVDRFVTNRNRRKLPPHKNNESLVHRIKGFHLLGMYVDEGYVQGWEDEDKDLNVFDYVSEVYDLSTKALLGEKEFVVNKKQEEGLDKIQRVIKQESVKELVDGNNGLVDDKKKVWNQLKMGKLVLIIRLKMGNCSFNQGYVYKANINGEFILKAEQVFDPGGIHSFGIWGCEDGMKVSWNKNEMSYKFRNGASGSDSANCKFKHGKRKFDVWEWPHRKNERKGAKGHECCVRSRAAGLGLNNEGNLGHLKFDVWKWPHRKKERKVLEHIGFFLKKMRLCSDVVAGVVHLLGVYVPGFGARFLAFLGFPAIEVNLYEGLAKQLVHQGYVLELFACAFDQAGVAVLKAAHWSRGLVIGEGTYGLSFIANRNTGRLYHLILAAKSVEVLKGKEVMDNICGCSNEIRCLGVVITTDKSQTVYILLLEFADVIKEPDGKGLTKINAKFDVLAFGCTVFEILTDKQLWFSYKDLKFLGLKKRALSGMLHGYGLMVLRRLPRFPHFS
uniref:Protein transport protein SEC23-like n=1 Tax=Tanacetum cinerariifolium TaxID=118510 RepID=A0A6L2JA44_TANCI|nr:protein transport protein SEC23-like [Tanacetum cinerariifolium]